MVSCYQKGALGAALADTLDEMVTSRAVTPAAAVRVLDEFDASMAQGLAGLASARLTFKGKLHTYQGVDDVWTLAVTDVTLRTQAPGLSAPHVEHCEALKVVACDAKLLGAEEE